jgi:hypothetical protein
VGENGKPSIGLTPDEKRWMRQGDKLWGNFRDKQPERRDFVWFFLGAIVFWIGGHAACPTRYT